MAGLKVRLDGKQYAVEVDPGALTLGELELLQERFGLADVREYNFLEPRQITGVVAVAVQRAHPELGLDEVMDKARKLKYGSFVAAFEALAEQEKADPTEPATGRGKSRNGRPSSPTTSASKSGTGTNSP
jgi:hypothetical protein